MKGHVRRTIANFGVVGPPHIVNHGVSTGASISFESFEDLGCDERICTQQTSHWECGLHTILSAWAIAFGFAINSDGQMDDEKYRLAIDVVNLVLDGHATCRMVVGLLEVIDFVRPLEEDKRTKYSSASLMRYTRFEAQAA